MKFPLGRHGAVSDYVWTQHRFTEELTDEETDSTIIFVSDDDSDSRITHWPDIGVINI